VFSAKSVYLHIGNWKVMVTRNIRSSVGLIFESETRGHCTGTMNSLSVGDVKNIVFWREIEKKNEQETEFHH
jgi:hypothetical protein